MFKKIALILLLLLAIVFAAKDLIIKSLVENFASSALGVDVRISKFHLGVLDKSLKINGLALVNPKGFPAGNMLYIDKIEAVCVANDLLKGKIHLSKAVFSLREIGIVRNASGVLNIDSIKMKKHDQVKDAAPKSSSDKADISFLIDNLELFFGKVYYIDNESGVTNFDVNLARRYENIDSTQKLAFIIVGDAMKSAGLKSVSGYLNKALKDSGVSGVDAGSVLNLFGTKKK